MTAVLFVKVDGNVYEVPILEHVTFTISQPMSGMQLDDVKLARQRVIEHYTSMGWTYVDNVITSFEDDPDPKPLWYLGESLELMSKCDVVIFMEGWEKHAVVSLSMLPARHMASASLRMARSN